MGRSIYERLSAVQAAMPPVPKARTNQQQGFKFRGIDDALESLVPLLAEHQVFFLPTVLEREVETRQTGKGSNLYTVHLHVRYTFFDADGNSLACDVWGEGTDSGDKATSKAMTMALKSALFQTFTISGEEDPDATGVSEAKSSSRARSSRRAPEATATEAKPRPSSSPPARPETISQLRDLVSVVQADAKGLLTYYSHNPEGGFEQLSEPQAQEAIVTLSKRVKESA
jgi:ERF superfamily protein